VLRARGFEEAKPKPSVQVAVPREVVPNMAAAVAAASRYGPHEDTFASSMCGCPIDDALICLAAHPWGKLGECGLTKPRFRVRAAVEVCGCSGSKSRAIPACQYFTNDNPACRSRQTLPPPPPRRPLTANGNVQGPSHQARRGHERHAQHLENKALYEVRARQDLCAALGPAMLST